MLIKQLHILQAFAPSDPTERERFLNGRARLLARTRRARLDWAAPASGPAPVSDEFGPESNGRPFPKIRADSSSFGLSSELSSELTRLATASRRAPSRAPRGRHTLWTSVGVSIAAHPAPGPAFSAVPSSPCRVHGSPSLGPQTRDTHRVRFSEPRVHPFEERRPFEEQRLFREGHDAPGEGPFSGQLPTGAGSLETGLWVLGALALALLL